ncbi:MAG: hypothetical protein C0502_10095 [Opitutus sp.]|nr:hypothetical protein [Opitutus sp.]
MNCRQATPLLSAARDGALSPEQRAGLARHVAECAACRQLQAEFAAAMAALRTDAARAAVPDADEEWRLLRARLSAPAKRTRRLAPVAWFTLPLAAAAALALVFFAGRPAAPELDGVGLAQADFVEVADPSATPIVYTDRESGVLVIWAANNSALVGE